MLTTKQVAERLNISRRRVQALISSGRLPAVKHGRDWMVEESNLYLIVTRKSGRPPKVCACGCGTPITSKRTATIYVYGHLHGPLEKRFWGRMKESGDCIVWQGCLNQNGYGQIRIRGKDDKFRGVLTHRLAWELTYGDIPDGMQVCHKCDNPACCRPEHLFIGTDHDNMHDKINKGRQLRGDTHPLHKLTEQDVHLIKELLDQGVKQRALARHYGVSPETIRSIAIGKTWKHVK